MDEDNKTCAELIFSRKESRMTELRELWDAYCDPDNEDNLTDDGECLDDFGLSFGYVEPHTWDDQPIGYWRYQLSWGGPSDEFRFHDTGRIEYRYHDWYDGAGADLEGDEYALMKDLAEAVFGLARQRQKAWEMIW